MQHRKVIPERTFVTGLCPFHKQYDNIVRMEASTGLLYFSDDVKKCHGCQPHLERGILLPSSESASEAPPVFVSMPYDEQGPVDEGFGWPRQPATPVRAPVPASSRFTCYLVGGTSTQRCDVCIQERPTSKMVYGVCEKCQTCEHCGKSTNAGVCKMCRYYESLHQHNTRHTYAKCPFCPTLTITAQPEESTENREIVQAPPVRQVQSPVYSDLNPTAPSFVPAEPSRARWFGII